MWSGLMLMASLLVACVVWYINVNFCAFGFGGFQCNPPFSGFGGALMIASVALWLVVLPVLAAVWLYRVWGWRRRLKKS